MKDTVAYRTHVALMNRVSSILLLVLGVAALAIACYYLVVPPFTDEELRENFVDTWEAHILGGTFMLFVYFLGTTLGGIGAWLAKSSRPMFFVALAAFALALVLEFISLELLTRRTERLVGHGLTWLI